MWNTSIGETDQSQLFSTRDTFVPDSFFANKPGVGLWGRQVLSSNLASYSGSDIGWSLRW